MDVLEGLALLAAGLVAGAINAVVGSGTLVTFPTLLAFGYAPVLANVPVLILLACALVILQPRLARIVAQRDHAPAHGGRAALVFTWLTGIYGGYFGAAQGVLLMGFLGILIDEHLQRLNAVKNILAGLVNLVAAIVFVLVSDVAWGAAACIASGSLIGGHFGGNYGRRLSPVVLR